MLAWMVGRLERGVELPVMAGREIGRGVRLPEKFSGGK